MNWKFFTPKLAIISGIVLFAALMRIVPHYPNFTPVAAIALFGGAHLNKRWLALSIPLIALFLSDLVLGFHAYMLPVYFSFALVVLLGGLLKKHIRVHSVVGASLAASVLFFLITNFAVWIGTSQFYPQNIAGLVSCYAAAIPFFHTSLLGDLFYSAVFFGGFYLVEQRYPALVKA